MTRRTTLSLVATFFLLIAFGTGYLTGYRKGRQAVRIHMAHDVSDSPQLRSSHQSRYEPYFTRGNPIPEEFRQ